MSFAMIKNCNLSLPLRHGGCGLRTHAISELRRLFVSSAMLVAPAVHAATSLSVAPAPTGAQDDDASFSPFEYSLRSSIENLSADGISSPDFIATGPRSAKTWASGASEKLYKNTKNALEGELENLPHRVQVCKRAGFVVRRNGCTVVSASSNLLSYSAQ